MALVWEDEPKTDSLVRFGKMEQEYADASVQEAFTRLIRNLEAGGVDPFVIEASLSLVLKQARVERLPEIGLGD